jgi:hypothetical protein
MKGPVQLLLFVCVVCLHAGQASAAGPEGNSALLLRERYAALAAQLSSNQFEQPLYLDSSESSGGLRGDIYARVDSPFEGVSAALNGPAHWCDILILHVNTKYCHLSSTAGGDMMAVNIGSKKPQKLEDTYRLEFAYRVVESTETYFQVQLSAEKGPLATSDYDITMEAVALNGGQTFLHFSYSYAYGFAGRLAMKTYLATTGRGKVGFTVVNQRARGEPEYIHGVRGLVERNTMRYYLAIEAYLDAVRAPPAEQLDERLNIWFAETERYPRQLSEVDRTAYVEMKRSDYQRQQSVPENLREPRS